MTDACFVASCSHTSNWPFSFTSLVGGVIVLLLTIGQASLIGFAVIVAALSINVRGAIASVAADVAIGRMGGRVGAVVAESAEGGQRTATSSSGIPWSDYCGGGSQVTWMSPCTAIAQVVARRPLPHGHCS